MVEELIRSHLAVRRAMSTSIEMVEMIRDIPIFLAETRLLAFDTVIFRPVPSEVICWRFISLVLNTPYLESQVRFPEQIIL